MAQRRRSGLVKARARVRELRGLVDETTMLVRSLSRLGWALTRLAAPWAVLAAQLVHCRVLL
jgi:hypothetical protein